MRLRIRGDVENEEVLEIGLESGILGTIVSVDDWQVFSLRVVNDEVVFIRVGGIGKGRGIRVDEKGRIVEVDEHE